MKAWGTSKIDWRRPSALWVAFAWILAVAWPPLPITLYFWPSNNIGVETIRDPRAIALVVGAVAVTAIFMFIDRERVRRRTPGTRFGVLVRFVAFGFIASLIAAALGDVALAVMALFSSGDALRRVDEAKETIVTGLAVMPVVLVLGVSYSVWAGLMAALIAFGKPRETGRPRHIMMDSYAPEAAPATITTFAAAPLPEPAPPPAPVGPHPETDIEAALRPDWD